MELPKGGGIEISMRFHHPSLLSHFLDLYFCLVHEWLDAPKRGSWCLYLEKLPEAMLCNLSLAIIIPLHSGVPS